MDRTCPCHRRTARDDRYEPAVMTGDMGKKARTAALTTTSNTASQTCSLRPDRYSAKASTHQLSTPCSLPSRVRSKAASCNTSVASYENPTTNTISKSTTTSTRSPRSSKPCTPNDSRRTPPSVSTSANSAAADRGLSVSRKGRPGSLTTSSRWKASAQPWVRSSGTPTWLDP